jgi:hypothetical protein
MKHHVRRSGGVAPFLTWAPDVDEWFVSRPCGFSLRKTPPATNSIGSWVGHRAGLDVIGRDKLLLLPEIELRLHVIQPAV